MLNELNSGGHPHGDAQAVTAAGTELEGQTGAEVLNERALHTKIPGHVTVDSPNGTAWEPYSAGRIKRVSQVESAGGNSIAEGQSFPVSQIAGAIGNTDTGGQTGAADLVAYAASNPLSDDGHGGCAATSQHCEVQSPHSAAIVGEITVHYRRYEDMRRARQRLELQAMATCRSLCDGDKVAGAKLYRKPDVNASAILMPYMVAMEPLDAAIADQAKFLDKAGKKLPVIDWCNDISGLSPRFLAMIVGECGIGPGEFRSVSALWKRMGMAVINGERQRRVMGDAALEHGYVARRRSLMWNIGESIIKQQVRNPKGDDGKPLGDPIAIGEYGQLYLDRKAYEATKADKPIIIHARAKRYMEKRLLRELWKAWRRGQSSHDDQEGSASPPNSQAIA